jgi:hypothetical protein
MRLKFDTPLSSQQTASPSIRHDAALSESAPHDQWEAAGPVVPVAGEKPHARRIAAHEHSEAIVFDLVQPLLARGRLWSFHRETRCDKARRKGTREHNAEL